MNDSFFKLKILARAERILLQIQLRRVATQGALYVLIAFLVIAAIVMLHFSAYQALSAHLSAALTALVIGCADLGLVLILFAAARGVRIASQQEELAQELRDLAAEELRADIDEAKSELVRVSADLARIRRSLSVLSSGIGGIFSWIAPAFSKLLETLKTCPKDEPEQGKDD